VFKTGTLNVTPAVLTVAAINATAVYDQPIPTLTYGVTGFVNGDSSSVLNNSPNETTTATDGSGVGTYPISITQGTLTAANYSFQFVNGTLSITSGTTASIAPAQPVPATDPAKGSGAK
jgi:hypothetical protein